MDGRETTTRWETLRRSAGLGPVGTAVVREPDATHSVDDRSVGAGAR